MGLDDKNGRFFHHDVAIRTPNPGQQYTMVVLGEAVIIAPGPIVLLSKTEARLINEASRAGYGGVPVFKQGIIDRVCHPKDEF